jgi:hypothetical protein
MLLMKQGEKRTRKECEKKRGNAKIYIEKKKKKVGK